VKFKQKDHLWVNFKQKDHLWVNFKHFRFSVGTPLFSQFWVVLVDTKHARVYANVTGFEDNEESPVHILLLTHSVTVEGFLYM